MVKGLDLIRLGQYVRQFYLFFYLYTVPLDMPIPAKALLFGAVFLVVSFEIIYR